MNRRSCKLAVLVAMALLGGLLAPSADATPAINPGGVAELGGQFPNPVPTLGNRQPGRAPMLSSDGSQVLIDGDLIVDTGSGVVSELIDHLGLVVDVSGDFRFLLSHKAAPRNFGETDEQLYRFDRVTQTNLLVADSAAFGPTRSLTSTHISDDGRYVAFINFDRNRGVELVRVDAAGGVTQRLAVSDEFPDFADMELAGNGRFAVYLEKGNINQTAVWRAGRYDFSTGENRTLREFVFSFADNPFGLGIDISADGRFIVVDGFLFDVATSSEVQFVSRAGPIVSPQGDSWSTPVGVSDDGSLVAFATVDALVQNDTNGLLDIYSWTRSDGQYRRLSRTDRGTELDGAAFFVELSDNGTTAIFSTGAFNASRDDPTPVESIFIVHPDTNPSPDVGLVDVAARPGGGLWRLYRSGEVRSSNAPTFTNCLASIFGASPGPRPLLLAEESVTSMSPTPSGEGYWLFTDLGRVIPCGDAQHFGDLSALVLSGRIVDSVATPTGLGYYMVGADGGLFAFGDAVFRGSVPEVLPGVPLAGAIVAITATSTNGGYRMVASDGGMFNFGDAAFFGSVPQVLPGVRLAGDVVGMIASDRGYLVLGEDGGIFNFGESQFHGSLGGQIVPRPVASVAVNDDLSGYVMFDSDGTAYPFGTDIDTLQ